MSKKHGVLLGWIDTIQASNNLSFESIDELYKLYSSSNNFIGNPMSTFGFRRIINQIIDWKLNKFITKTTRRSHCRNITSYFILLKTTIRKNKDDNRYKKYQSNNVDSSTVIPSNLYTREQLSMRHIRVTLPTRNSSTTSDMPSLTSQSLTSPSLTSSC